VIRQRRRCVDAAGIRQRFLDPAAQVVEMEDVATVIEFLVSDKASFLTGDIIQVNGGQDFL
jgi:NAD(P)-dependent dehydrogenase (short-subunit alcohol dehydrogenase family)